MLKPHKFGILGKLVEKHTTFVQILISLYKKYKMAIEASPYVRDSPCRSTTHQLNESLVHRSANVTQSTINVTQSTIK